ncbi:MAG: putative glycoside hydrolase [Chloroflexota bacterium]
MTGTFRSQRGTIVIAATTAIALLAAVAAALFLLPARTLSGQVVDAASGQPLVGAVVSAAGQQFQVGEDGSFAIPGVRFGSAVAAEARGYLPASSAVALGDQLRLTLAPRVLEGVVMDASAGKPVAGVQLVAGTLTARSDEQGRFDLVGLDPGAEIEARVDGFAPLVTRYEGQPSVDLALEPNVLDLKVLHRFTGEPVVGAEATDGRNGGQTDRQGRMRLRYLPEGAEVTVKGEGFAPVKLVFNGQAGAEVLLRPDRVAGVVKGLYLTYYGVGSDALRGHVLKLADSTEVNSVVIDVKGDRGWIAYRSSVPMVKEIGAQQEIMIQDPRAFLAELKKRGVYSIARIVTFKDKPLSTARPDLSVMNSDTGKPWVDNEGLTWADPTRQEVWDYNIALATEAIELGFDEVQFDYVRFPTDAGAGNPLSSIGFSKANTMANRLAAINGFLEKAKEAIHAKGGLISADIFGYVVWRDDDMGIGQKLEELAERVDYVSPMVYPNLFWDGIPAEGGARYANQQAGLYPYEVVYESMKMAARRIGAEKLRPWLQYYNDYLTGKGYTAADVDLQKRATYENGITGWLFWDPSNRFDKGGFAGE